MKRLIFSVLLALTTAVVAQTKPQAKAQATPKPDRDSIALVDARWSCDTVNGMILKRFHFKNKQLFRSNQFIAVLEIPRNAPYHVEFSHEWQRTKTSVQARKRGAVAAINGSFFDMDRHNPICYLRIDGRDLGENTAGSDPDHRKYYQYGSMFLNNGRPSIFKTDSARNAEKSLETENIMTAGPLLVMRSKEVSQRDDRTFITQRHNRTAIGTKADGTTILLVVDGRSQFAAGMSIPELCKIMRWMGCREALNLDGGGSTTLWMKENRNIKNLDANGIVNFPSDNGKFDHYGERAVSNCVIVVPNK